MYSGLNFTGGGCEGPRQDFKLDINDCTAQLRRGPARLAARDHSWLPHVWAAGAAANPSARIGGDRAHGATGLCEWTAGAFGGRLSFTLRVRPLRRRHDGASLATMPYRDPEELPWPLAITLKILSST